MQLGEGGWGNKSWTCSNTLLWTNSYTQRRQEIMTVRVAEKYFLFFRLRYSIRNFYLNPLHGRNFLPFFKSRYLQIYRSNLTQNFSIMLMNMICHYIRNTSVLLPCHLPILMWLISHISTNFLRLLYLLQYCSDFLSDWTIIFLDLKVGSSIHKYVGSCRLFPPFTYLNELIFN